MLCPLPGLAFLAQLLKKLLQIKAHVLAEYPHLVVSVSGTSIHAPPLLTSERI